MFDGVGGDDLVDVEEALHCALDLGHAEDVLDATVLKPKANIQDEDAAPRREDAVVEARFLGVEK